MKVNSIMSRLTPTSSAGDLNKSPCASTQHTHPPSRRLEGSAVSHGTPRPGQPRGYSSLCYAFPAQGPTAKHGTCPSPTPSAHLSLCANRAGMALPSTQVCSRWEAAVFDSEWRRREGYVLIQALLQVPGKEPLQGLQKVTRGLPGTQAGHLVCLPGCTRALSPVGLSGCVAHTPGSSVHRCDVMVPQRFSEHPTTTPCQVCPQHLAEKSLFS